MATAPVTGSYTTIAGTPLPEGAFVQATPSEAVFTLDGRGLSMEPEDGQLAPNGTFIFNLEPTTNVAKRGFHYIITGGYLEPHGYGRTGHTRHDVFSEKIVVPDGGGNIGDLTVLDTDYGLAWQGPTPPATSMLWLYTEPAYDPTTGAPLPVYTAPDGTTVEHGELVEWSA